MTVGERLARRLGLWSLWGRIVFVYYAWARKEINPLHPDAAMVGRRYNELRREFAR